MKNRKNIDKLFEEGFKNFEPTPPSHVWEKIQTELSKKKKERKVIPLWIKYGGVAAVLALLLTVGNFVINTPEPVKNTITNKHHLDPIDKLTDGDNISAPVPSETRLATESENDRIPPSSENGVNANTQNLQPKNSSSKSIIATAERENKTSTPHKKDSQDVIGDNGREKYDAGIANSTTVSGKNEIANEQIGESGNANEGSKDIDDSFKKTQEKSDNRISGIVIPENKEDSNMAESDIQSENKLSILDAIAENKKGEKDIKVEQQPSNRWSITPNVAPVYYGSLGNGSSIDQDFSNNPQKGDVNMSYGLKVSYAINNKLSIRSGVNNVDLSYSTADIIIGTGPVAMALKSIDYGSKQIVVTALSREKLRNPPSSNGFENLSLKSTGSDGRLIQNINYFEIPLEIKYALVDSKFGVNLIGGVSTLFLGNNEVSVKSDNFSSVLGEANNLADVSFSTNIGLGIDYNLSKRFVFNIEPMFKYQLNPYTDSSVNFKPYYLGVYSGLSFKF